MFKDTKSYIVASAGSLILLGSLGNILVIVAVYKKRYLRSTTNYLFINIACSDIISAVFLLSFVIARAFPPEKGNLGDYLCKFIISLHIPFSASFSSILTLTTIAVERYHAIVKPMAYGRRLQVEQVKYVLIGIWVSAFAVSSPIYYYSFFDGDECLYSISVSSRNSYLKTLIILTVFTPFFTISFCYTAVLRELYFKSSTIWPPTGSTQQEAIEKRQLFRVSALVTSAFIAFYLPLAVILFMSTFDKNEFDSKYYKYPSILFFLETVVNPIVYASQSSNFRRAFKELLPCFCRSF